MKRACNAVTNSVTNSVRNAFVTLTPARPGPVRPGPAPTTNYSPSHHVVTFVTREAADEMMRGRR